MVVGELVAGEVVVWPVVGWARIHFEGILSVYFLAGHVCDLWEDWIRA